MEVLEHCDTINYKSTAAFPEYKSVISDQTEETMTKEQKKKQKFFNKSINLGSQKVGKVFWSEIVEVKFEVKDPEKIFFKYSYNENYRVAVFSAMKHQLRHKDIEMRTKSMKKYTNPCGISAQKKS